MDIFLKYILTWAAKLLTGVSSDEFTRIKNLVLEYETDTLKKVLPSDQKHAEVATFVNTLVTTTSTTVIDFLIKMALLWARKTSV